MSPMVGALQFAVDCNQISHMVLGVTSLAELKEIVDRFGELSDSPMDFAPMAVADPAVTDPRVWKEGS